MLIPTTTSAITCEGASSLNDASDIRGWGEGWQEGNDLLFLDPNCLRKTLSYRKGLHVLRLFFPTLLFLSLGCPLGPCLGRDTSRVVCRILESSFWSPFIQKATGLPTSSRLTRDPRTMPAPPTPHGAQGAGSGCGLAASCQGNQFEPDSVSARCYWYWAVPEP